jgi:cytidine deaminase
MIITETHKQQLVTEVMAALRNCYPKNCRIAYAAAVLVDAGEIYAAANYSSDTGSLTLHGEQAALSHAAAHGKETVHAIAITSTEQVGPGEFVAPCHMCKQLLWESRRRSGVPLLIILANQHGETKEAYVDDLMVWPWPAV